MYQRLFQEMMEAAALHEVLLDADGSVVDFSFIAVNAEFSRLSGLPEAGLVGKRVSECFPSVNPEWLRLYQEVAVSGNPARLESYSTLLRRSFEIRAFRVQNGIVACLFLDITDRQEAADALARGEAKARHLVETLRKSEAALASLLNEKDALLKEVHHRVKNNLQIIVSLMNIERSALEGACPSGSILGRMQDRIAAMAEVHYALYHSPTLAAANLSVALRSLADRLADTYDAHANGIRIEVSDGELLLPLDRAVPCCLAVNELVTNALQHAFPTAWSVEKTIRLIADLTDAGRVELIVRDNGIGMTCDVPSAADGIAVGGLSLARLMTDQLDGELHISVDNGTTVRLTFSPA